MLQSTPLALIEGFTVRHIEEKRITNSVYKLLLALFLITNTGTALAQEVRDEAFEKGVLFGSPLFELFDESNKQLFRENVSVGTVPAYWKYTTRLTPEYTSNSVSG